MANTMIPFSPRVPKIRMRWLKPYAVICGSFTATDGPCQNEATRRWEADFPTGKMTGMLCEKHFQCMGQDATPVAIDENIERSIKPPQVE